MSAASDDQQAAPEALLVAVDDSEGSDKAFDFAVRHLHRPGVELHLVHVVPRLHFATAYGVPPVDFVPVADSNEYEKVRVRPPLSLAVRMGVGVGCLSYRSVIAQHAPTNTDQSALTPAHPNKPTPPKPKPKVIQKAEAFIIQRFVNKLPADFAPSPIVHIIKVGSGGWGVGGVGSSAGCATRGQACASSSLPLLPPAHLLAVAQAFNQTSKPVPQPPQNPTPQPTPPPVRGGHRVCGAHPGEEGRPAQRDRAGDEHPQQGARGRVLPGQLHALRHHPQPRAGAPGCGPAGPVCVLGGLGEGGRGGEGSFGFLLLCYKPTRDPQICLSPLLQVVVVPIRP